MTEDGELKTAIVSTPSVLITGAAGNLGSLLARHLLTSGACLRLMYHRTPLAADLANAGNVVGV